VGETSADIARWWLAKARRRRLFRNAVEPIMNNAKTSTCSRCKCKEDEGNPIQVKLSIDGEYDPQAMDRIIEKFEVANRLSPHSMTFDAWKAFFRLNAEFFMMCKRCHAEEQAEANRRRREVVYGSDARALRAKQMKDDRGSDSEGYEEGPVFDPITVDRKAPWGRLMSKWLISARVRLGGEFPRPHAKLEMESFAAKLRDRQAARARRQIEKRRAASAHADYVDPAKAAALQEIEALRRGGAGVDTPKDGAATAATGQQPQAPSSRRFGTAPITAASSALMQRWTRAARESLLDRETEHAEGIREELASVLSLMTMQEDWFYTREHRLRGEDLDREGEALMLQRRRLQGARDIRISEERRKLRGFIDRTTASGASAGAGFMKERSSGDV